MNRSGASPLKNFFALLSLSAIVLAGCSGSGGSNTASTTGSGSTPGGAGSASGAKLTIAVVPMGTTHEYWKALHAGAEDAAKELNVDIQWKGPLKEDDRAGQIGIVQGFTADNVSGIVLAPLDANALVRPVSEAMAKKIPVIVVDSPLGGEAGKDYTALIATNNKLGGSLGASRLAELLGDKGNVVMLRNAEGSASTAAREEGFLEEMKKHPGIKVISDNQRGGRTQSDAQTKAMQMVDVLRQANGIFCSNESTSAGMLQALNQNGMAGKVKFVAFDSSPTLVTGLKSGNIDALVVQNPRKMGYEGVKAIVTKIKGGTVPPNTDTGVTLVD
ncbi:sugar ABC transporter substrate-binding protein, partial [bacterium]